MGVNFVYYSMLKCTHCNKEVKAKWHGYDRNLIHPEYITRVDNNGNIIEVICSYCDYKFRSQSDN